MFTFSSHTHTRTPRKAKKINEFCVSLDDAVALFKETKKKKTTRKMVCCFSMEQFFVFWFFARFAISIFCYVSVVFRFTRGRFPLSKIESTQRRREWRRDFIDENCLPYFSHFILVSWISTVPNGEAIVPLECSRYPMALATAAQRKPEAAADLCRAVRAQQTTKSETIKS